MATYRPSSAQLFSTIDGVPAAEAGEAPLICNLPGMHQFLGHEANHHDGQSTLGPEGNRIPRRSLPVDRAVPVGPPDAVNPLGRHAGESQGGGDAGE